MSDDEKNEEKAESSAEEAKESEEKAEEAAEKTEEAAEEAEKAEDKAEEAAEEAKEAVEEVKETVAEVKEPARNALARDASQIDASGSQGDAGGEVKEEKKKVKVSGKLGDIIKNIEELSVLELSELVKALEQKFGVSAAAPMAIAGPAAAAGAEEAEQEGQTTFNVILANGGANKISVIKAVRELVPTLGLKEAKDLVDGAPKTVLEGVGKDAANEAKQKLEAAGGKAELK